MDSAKILEGSKNKKIEPMEEIELKPWAELPHVVLTKIFSLLDRKDGLNASATCRHWRSNYFQPRLWEYLEIRFTPDKLDSARFLSGTLGRTIKNVSVFLNTSSEYCLKECIKFLQHLAVNNNLRSLNIIPLFSGVQSRSELWSVPDSIWHLRHKLVDQLKECLSNLDTFSIGCAPELFSRSLIYLLKRLNPSVKKIRLSSYKTSPYLPGVIFDPALIRRFTELQVILIDSTQLSRGLSGYFLKPKLKKE
ncbi:uncharacterized protein [Leptinotarsa decemlineata]|uniref:uncharacterized protein n=1 Tax=Leptinotarsa decemlineata TaxID=7539 RepID=UPI003D3092F4